MKVWLAVLFVFLALSAGILIGYAIAEFAADSTRPRRKAWNALGLGALLGIAAICLYSFGFPAGYRIGAPSPVARSRAPWEDFQFELDEIKIPRADAGEAIRSNISVPDALAYLDQGAEVWNKKYKCIGCHVNAVYLLVRPSLSPVAGHALTDTRDFFLKNLESFVGKKEERLLLAGNKSAQVVWAALGLASWDAHTSGVLSPDTDAMLRCMFRLQRENGAWSVPNCWPPLQSESFQLSAVAAIAVSMAPGWLESVNEPELESRIDLLRTYLQGTPPPHEYAQLWRVWASTWFPGLLKPEQRSASLESLWKRQHEDGGWALRDFAEPAEWGEGARQHQLEKESDYHQAPSDGHMTGLAVCVARDAGIPATDPRIEKAVKWILTNQRETGRWWAKSLNTQTYEFLTYSATCFALAALAKCDRLPIGAPLDDHPRLASK
ncbi:MAG TPA: hypothetical protein PLP42_09520 [Acidobacteriota bacterium]|nr:hypothetical protein [Acidobacteriota bacterium]